jgi:hypothetical protein
VEKGVNQLKDVLRNLLKSFGYPVDLQGTIATNEAYPPFFFTFWNYATDLDSFYDNDSHRHIWRFEVNFYGVDPLTVESVMSDALQLLKINGWTLTELPHDVASDEDTHTGRGAEVIFLDPIIKYQ